MEAMFLRNVGWNSTNYTASYPRWYSSRPFKNQMLSIQSCYRKFLKHCPVISNYKPVKGLKFLCQYCLGARKYCSLLVEKVLPQTFDWIRSYEILEAQSVFTDYSEMAKCLCVALQFAVLLVHNLCWPIRIMELWSQRINNIIIRYKTPAYPKCSVVENGKRFFFWENENRENE
jgi:hypothetical protein